MVNMDSERLVFGGWHWQPALRGFRLSYAKPTSINTG